MVEGWAHVLLFQDSRFELQAGEQTVGRSKNCEVAINDPSVSRKHVILKPAPSYILLVDLGSSNGTFINGKKVQGEGVLENGDVLRLGDAEIRVEVRQNLPAPDLETFKTLRMQAPRQEPGDATFFLAAESMKLAEAVATEGAAFGPGSHMVPAPLQTQRIDVQSMAAAPTQLQTQRLDVNSLAAAAAAAETAASVPAHLPGPNVATQRLDVAALGLPPVSDPAATMIATQRLDPTTLAAVTSAAPPPAPLVTQRLDAKEIFSALATPALALEPTALTAGIADPVIVANETIRLSPSDLRALQDAPTPTFADAFEAPTYGAFVPPPAEAEISFADLDQSAISKVKFDLDPLPAVTAFVPDLEPEAAPAPAPAVSMPVVSTPVVVAPPPQQTRPSFSKPSFEPQAPPAPPFAPPTTIAPPPAFSARPGYSAPAAAAAPLAPPPPAAPIWSSPPSFDRPMPPAAPPPPIDPSRAGGLRQPSSAGELLPSLDEIETFRSAEIHDPLTRSTGSFTSQAPVLAGTPCAGFGIRLAAALLDSAWTAGLVVAAQIFSSNDPIFVVPISILSSLVIYFGWSIWGTTPGKRVLGLYIHSDDGQAGIGFLRAFLRVVGYVLSCALFGLPFLMVLFTKDRRGLHDRIAGTWVYRHG